MIASVLEQLTLAPASLASFVEVSRSEADRLCVEWDHYLGGCDRPFGQQHFAFVVAGRPVGVAVSASTVSATVRGDVGDGPFTLSRVQVVELARLATAERWATRVMLRLWREVAAPLWPYWPTDAYVAYSRNDRHEGRIYRFDGWERFTTRGGSPGGGTWSRKRTGTDDPTAGKKTGWIWRAAS